MRLTPREMERLLIFTTAELARKHRARGLKLNQPEAAAPAEVATSEPAAPTEDAWAFDVEPEPAAEVAPTFAPPPDASLPGPSLANGTSSERRRSSAT